MKQLALIAILLVAGCNSPEPDMQMQYAQRQAARPANVAVPSPDQERFQVTRVGVFKDDLAYGGGRGVYVIVDTKTGKEFVGVSGVGVSELGRHQSGKTSVTDER